MNMGKIEYITMGCLGVCIGNLLGTTATYYITTKLLNLEKIIDESAARNHAQKMINRMKRKGWVYNHTISFGSRTACEEFLQKNKEE